VEKGTKQAECSSVGRKVCHSWPVPTIGALSITTFCDNRFHDDTVSQFGFAIVLEAGVPAVSGVVAGIATGVAVRRLRRGVVYTGLARLYVVLAGLFTVTVLGYAGLQMVSSPETEATFVSYFIIIVPWTLFAVRYVGMERYITRRRILVGITVVAGVLVANLLLVFPGVSPLNSGFTGVLGTVQSVVTLAIVTFVFALVAAVIGASYSHGRLSTVQGVVLALPVIILVFVFQATRPSTPLLNDTLIAGGFATTAGSLLLGVTRYDLLTRPPGTRIRGERAALTETDEAIVVIDNEQRVIRTNESARQTFGDPTTLSDVTEHSIATLTERTTITCRTTAGQREFDPSVSPLVDDYDDVLGHTITLIDVTEREIRRQRLAVLNRILRHNVRNELDVIRAHAEEADLTPAIRSVDRIDRLSEETRRIQQLMGRSVATRTPTELCPLLEDIVADVTAGTNANVTVKGPDLTVSLDPKRCRYAVRQLVENAIQHNDTQSPRVVVRSVRSESGVQIVVADDGPGIPASERTAIESGTEEPLEHASSVGLWGTNWAVQSMGGSLSFGESDLGGAAVTISLPSEEVPDIE
jgi:signal transduction histidine kinase